jgi:hypothetical protein
VKKIKVSCTLEDKIEQFASKKYIAIKDKYDVENGIQSIRNTIDDLDSFIDMYVDSPTVLTEDEVWNYLEGIKSVLTLRVEQLWNAHIQREHLDGYGDMHEVMACKAQKKDKKK